MLKILEDLINLARERKTNPVEDSYTNKLLEDKSLAKEKVLEEISELIEAKDRSLAGPTVPSKGLILKEISY